MANPTMPDLIKELVVQRISTEKSRCALRKVDTKFRELVDRMCLQYTKLTIKVSDTKIFVTIEPRGEKVQKLGYLGWPRGNYVLVNACEGNVKHLNGVDMLETAVRDFETIILRPHLKVDTLSVEVSEDASRQDADRFFARLQKAFEKRERQLRVESLRIDIYTGQPEILSILPFIEPGYLKQVDFTAHREIDEPIRMKEVFQTEQIRALRSYTSGGFISKVKLARIPDFQELHITLYEVTAAEVLAFKTRALANPSFRSAIITCEIEDLVVIAFDLKAGSLRRHPEITFKASNGKTLSLHFGRYSLIFSSP